MNNDATLSGHISSRFNQELEDLRNKVLIMGGLVETQVSNGLTSLLESDSALAEKVVEMDDPVNALEIEIDEKCVEILARRSPTAKDLRLVVAIIKTITDLERIGDQAQKLGELELELIDEGSSTAEFVKLGHLGKLVLKMLHNALDAFARMDDQAALKIIGKDNKIDVEYDALLRQLITHMMEDPRTIKSALRVSWCARSLERIGNHVTNICEYIIFLVQGKDVRHLDYKEIKNRMKK